MRYTDEYMVKKTRSLKVKTRRTKQDVPWIVAFVEACVLAVVVLYSGFVIYDLTQQLRGARLGDQGSDRRAVASPADTAYFCQRDLNVCKQELADLAASVTTSSRSYVLDSGALFVREWNEQEVEQNFWLVNETGEGAAATLVKKLVGRFEVAEGPGRAKAFSIKRLTNGLYEFVVTADYTEAGSKTIGFIDPKTLDFLTFTDSSERSDGLTVTTPAIADGFISPHFSSESCATSSQAVVDRLDWNKEVLYKFRKPPTIKCFFNELGGQHTMQALAGVTDRSVSRDLKSFVLSMPTGQKLRLQFKGANKPTVTVVP